MMNSDTSGSFPYRLAICGKGRIKELCKWNIFPDAHLSIREIKSYSLRNGQILSYLELQLQRKIFLVMWRKLNVRVEMMEIELPIDFYHVLL